MIVNMAPFLGILIGLLIVLGWIAAIYNWVERWDIERQFEAYKKMKTRTITEFEKQKHIQANYDLSKTISKKRLRDEKGRFIKY